MQFRARNPERRPAWRQAVHGATLWLCLGTDGAAHDAPPTAPIEFEATPKHVISLLGLPSAAAISRDGELLATADHHGTILLWDVADARPLRRIAAHADTVSALAFHPECDWLASSGYDGHLRLWNAETGELLATFSGHDGRITTLAVSSDGGRLLSGGTDATLRVWDAVHPAAEPGILRGHSATIRALAFTPVVDRFASSDAAGTVRVWDAASLSPISSRQMDLGPAETLAFLSDGRLCLGAVDGTVVIWSTAADDDGVSMAQRHNSAVTRLTVAPDGATLATVDRQGEVRVWDVATREMTSSLSGHTDELAALRFRPDSRALFTVGLDRTVRLWPAKRPATPRLAVLEAPDVRLWSLAFDARRGRLYAAGRKGFLGAWDLVSHELARSFDGFSGTIDAIALSTDGAQLAACGWKETRVLLWDAVTGESRGTFDAGVKVRCVRFSADGRRLAAGCEDGTIRVWELNGPADPRTLPAASLPVYDLSFSPDGELLASCTGDWTKADPGVVTLWSSDGWSEARRLTEHTRAVRAVVFSADGGRFASAGEDGVIIVYHSETHVPLARLTNPAGVRPLAFSSDGARLAAGLHDGTINVWSTERGEVVQRFKAEDDVFGLSFNADGSLLYSVSGETRIEVWPVVEQQRSRE